MEPRERTTVERGVGAGWGRARTRPKTVGRKRPNAKHRAPAHRRMCEGERMPSVVRQLWPREDVLTRVRLLTHCDTLRRESREPDQSVRSRSPRIRHAICRRNQTGGQPDSLNASTSTVGLICDCRIRQIRYAANPGDAVTRSAPDFMALMMSRRPQQQQQQQEEPLEQLEVQHLELESSNPFHEGNARFTWACVRLRACVCLCLICVSALLK